LKRVRGHVNAWIDVSARPKGFDDMSDVTAVVGGDWKQAPKASADRFIEVNLHHAQFEDMMKARAEDGRSARDILDAGR